MLYGKISCHIADQTHGNVRLTVADGTSTIRQDRDGHGDIIRLSRSALRELANDALAALDELEAGKAA